MIARLWHGAVPESQADAYYQYLLRTGLADYRRTPGNQGVTVLRRVQDRVAHFQLLTFWESYEAIQAFTGPDYEQARYYPEDAAFLLEMKPYVTHYEALPLPE